MPPMKCVFKSNVLNTYSSTETAHMGLAAGEVLEMRRTRGNCFQPCAEVQIVSETGAPLPAGREGRIRARSWAMGWSFAGNLMQTDEMKGDGWFYPGDVGRIDADGLLIVTGRVDEVINDGGVKFAPEVLEERLQRHPAIDKVAIVRMQSESGPTEAWIAVVGKAPLSLPLIHEWMEQNVPGELGSVKFARLCTVDSLPMTQAGKIARQELRNVLARTQN
jgi:acyl-coenzyme A synthetase/AMP-(fatty) acid ligase